MAIFIGHTTAAWVYLSPRTSIAELRKLRAETECDRVFSQATASLAEVRDVALPTLGSLLKIDQRALPRIDVLVPKREDRRAGATIQSHLWAGPLASGSFLRLANDVYLSTPELCFLQMAASLQLPDLLKFGMELCGDYSSSLVASGMVKAKAVTTQYRVCAFVDRVADELSTSVRCPTPRGLRRAETAASWIMDRSRSPMETSLALLLTLRRSLGGYGLPRPLLNERFELSQEAARVGGSPYYVLDLFYPSAKLALEYNGRDFHRDGERDMRRELALGTDGISVIPVGHEQVRNSVQLNGIVAKVAAATGKRLRPCTPRLAQARRNLRTALLPQWALGTGDGRAVTVACVGSGNGPQRSNNGSRRRDAAGFAANPWALPAALSS